jgi:hypothetical protein
VPWQVEREVLAPADPERRLDQLRACWARFDDIAARVSAELLPGSRSAGRGRDQIVRHVVISEPEQFSRKVEVRTEPGAALTPDGLAGHREAYLVRNCIAILDLARSPVRGRISVTHGDGAVPAVS